MFLVNPEFLIIVSIHYKYIIISNVNINTTFRLKFNITLMAINLIYYHPTLGKK